MTQKPVLIFPIETKAREFPARVFLAGLAVQRGYSVIMGRSKILHRALYRFPRGILLENDASPRSRIFFETARRLGFKIIAWDEESLVTLTDDIYAALRTDPRTIAQIEYFFCRGEGDRNAVARAYPQIAEKLVAAGNPRLDILNPRWFQGGAKVPAHDRKTVLINSRFSIVNPFFVAPEIAKDNVFKKFGIAKESETGRHIHGWLDHAHAMFLKFADLTRRICAENPDMDIIIRPHPSENHDFWKDLASEYPNAQSLYEGAASDWFLKADMLVHNSCTTAMEASLVGLPCLTYLPDGDNIYDAEVPNSVSRKFQTPEDMIAAIRAQPLLNEEIRDQTARQARKDLSSVISCVENAGCGDSIMDHVDRIHLDRNTSGMVIARLKNFVREMVSILGRFKDDVKSQKNLRELRKARIAYAQQKFPGISAAEIQALLEKYGYSDFSVRPYMKDWYEIRADLK